MPRDEEGAHLMLSVTKDAAAAMRMALERAEIPDSNGLRISAEKAEEPVDNGSQPMLRLDVVTAVENRVDDEIVVAPGGIQVFIEPRVAPLLDDKVLDGVVEPSGRAAFRIMSQR
jgi:Fe-S cluster assembly iron-binding protein IscA